MTVTIFTVQRDETTWRICMLFR